MSSPQAATRRKSVTVPKKSAIHGNEHSIFLALLKREGLPTPTPEVRFAAPRRWRFDYAWTQYEYAKGYARTTMVPAKVAIEVEGGAFTRGRHTRGKGFIADMEKYNEAAVRGWIVLRVTPQQLCTLDTIALIKRALTA